MSVKTYIDEFDADLDDVVTGDGRYEFRVALIPQMRPKTKADAAINWGGLDDLTPEQRKEVERVGAIVRNRQVPVPDVGYLPGRSRPRSAGGSGSSSPSSITRPAGSTSKSAPPRPAATHARSETNPDFCIYSKAFRRYTFTSAWIDKLERELGESERHCKILGRQSTTLQRSAGRRRRPCGSEPAGGRPTQSSNIWSMAVTPPALQQQWRAHIRTHGTGDVLETQDEDLALPMLIETFEPEQTQLVFGAGEGMHAMIDEDNDIRVSFSASFLDTAGNEIGTIGRTIDTGRKSVSHDALLLDRSRQGEGITSRMMRRSLTLYDELGIEEININARFSGRYVWTLFGFDFASKEEAAAVYWPSLALHQKLRSVPSFPTQQRLAHAWDYPVELDFDDQGRDITVTRDALVDALGPDYIRKPSDLPDEMPMSMALLAHGYSKGWTGRLDLRTGKEARNRLLRYLARKGL